MKLLTILFLLFTTMIQAEAKIQTDLPLQYLASENTGKDKPLIIFLHGYGSNEEDLFELKNEFKKDYNYLSVRAPMPLGGPSYQWYNLQASPDLNEIKKNGKLLEDFIKEAVKKYQTKESNVILIGFSQGAIMSYELALRHPKSVRGIVALSGKILPELQKLIVPGLDLKALSIFIGHGTIDDRIHVREATLAQSLIEKTSIKPAFHSYPGMGHSINQTELSDIKKWMEQVLSE